VGVVVGFVVVLVSEVPDDPDVELSDGSVVVAEPDDEVPPETVPEESVFPVLAVELLPDDESFVESEELPVVVPDEDEALPEPVAVEPAPGSDVGFVVVESLGSEEVLVGAVVVASDEPVSLVPAIVASELGDEPLPVSTTVPPEELLVVPDEDEVLPEPVEPELVDDEVVELDPFSLVSN